MHVFATFWVRFLEAIILVRVGIYLWSFGGQEVNRMSSTNRYENWHRKKPVPRRCVCEQRQRARGEEGGNGGGKPSPWVLGGTEEKKKRRWKGRKNGRRENVKKGEGSTRPDPMGRRIPLAANLVLLF